MRALCTVVKERCLFFEVALSAPAMYDRNHALAAEDDMCTVFVTSCPPGLTSPLSCPDDRQNDGIPVVSLHALCGVGVVQHGFELQHPLLLTWALWYHDTA